jgi:hypothetical protein
VALAGSAIPASPQLLAGTGIDWATISPWVFSFFLFDLRHRLNWEEKQTVTKIPGSAEAKLVPCLAAQSLLCDTLERGSGEGIRPYQS